MDASHLSKAHDHARAAAVATKRTPSPDTTVAVTEHTHAAGEFANAAQSTSSLEALRTLKLLEQHHKRLAELLTLPPEVPAKSQDEESDGEINEKAASTKTPASLEREGSGGSTATRPGQKPAVGQTRREMSSSIASNLASARGIRSTKYRGQPLSPGVSNDHARGKTSRRDTSKSKIESGNENESGKPTWVPPVTVAVDETAVQRHSGPTTVKKATATTAGTDDAGYGRFYNTFGSIINKISAPLAFAGLPLIQEESGSSEQESQPKPKAPKRTSRPRSSHGTPSRGEADLSQIYSKATMRALGRDGQPTGAGDSFYVVPTSGHTLSYASILIHDQKEKRRLGASMHSELSELGGDEDFVDARETPAPLSPGAKRKIGRAKSEKELNNTIEELWMENTELKDMLDKLTKRLHAFEASSQTSAMALAESYRVMRPGSPGEVVKTGSATTKEMEEQLAATMKQMDRLERDNRKMQKTLEKYREKWEVLKAGAKARREGKGDASTDDAAAGSSQTAL